MRKILLLYVLAVLMSLAACDHKELEPPVISGTVTDAATNQPIPYAIVTTEPFTIGTSETGESGEFQFECPEPGSYKVKVEARGYLPQDREVDVRGGRIARVAFKLVIQPLVVTPEKLAFASNVTGGVLTIQNRGHGTLTWKITPSPEAWLTVSPPLEGTVGAIPETVPVNVSRIGLADGAYTAEIVVTSNGGIARIPATMIINKNIPSPAVLQICLLNARSGEPIADGLVRVENGPTGRTDERGVVQLDGLPRSRHIRLKASKEWYLANQLELDLPIQGDLEIRLKPLPHRVGTVFEGDKPFATPEQIALDPLAGRAYVTNRKANAVSVINTWGDNVMETIPVNQFDKAGLKWARGIAVNPARNEVYVANFWSGSVSVLDTLKSEEVDQIPVGDSPIALDVSADRRTLYVSRAPKDNGDVVVVDLISRRIIKRIPIGGEPSGIARKGKFIYLANSRQNTVFVIDVQRYTISKVIPVGANPTAVVASPKRNFVYVANSFDDTISIIDTIDQRVIEDGVIPVGHHPSGLAVDAEYDDGDVVYVTNYHDRSLSVIDIATRTGTDRPITVGASPIGVAVLDGGNKVYVVNSGSDDVSILGFN